LDKLLSGWGIASPSTSVNLDEGAAAKPQTATCCLADYGLLLVRGNARKW